MPPLSQEEIEEILRKIREAYDKVRAEFQKFVDGVENFVRKWVPWAYGKLMELLGWISAKLTEVETELRKFVTQPGQPWTLWTVGDTWTNAVGAATSRWSGNFTAGAMHTDDEWQGHAADSYEKSFSPQSTALAAVKSATDAIDDALGKLAMAIGTAWLALAAATVAFVSEIVTEAAATVASEGAAAPATVPAAAGSTGKWAGLIAAALGVLETFVVSTVLPAFKDLNQLAKDNEAFPVGTSGQNEWPRLTSDISDSSHRQNHGKNAPWEMTKA